MRAAIIEAGVVVNIAQADAGTATAQGWIPLADDTRVDLGWSWDGKNFQAPTPSTINPE